MTETPIEKYLNVIGAYDNEFKKWEARSTKIVKRYRDDNRSQNANETAKFNILWSNVQTLVPAVYSKMPMADVSRRFGDNDQVGRVASQIIQRAIDYEIEHYPDFRASMKNAVQDRFLGGRGVAWVRYEPHLIERSMPEDGLQVTEDADEVETYEEIEYECAPTDYVHWKDFGHSVARTWEEVTVVWRWVFMSKEALIERFGEESATKIPLDSGPQTLTSYGQSNKEHTRAKICELWDKETGKVYWFSKNSNYIIDERDDPIEVEGFFPCGKPLYATLTSDSLVPVPDFVLYQDQASELDILSDRIDGLVKALRVRGVYDASQPSLQRLLTEGDNNTLIPVDKWMAFSEKGGLKGAIDILPIDVIAATLINCYRAREDIKSQIYEITGISDIIRGQTSASETATAQQIKGQYAGLRLRAMQEEVALFASSLIKLKAQIMCTKFQPQTLLQYASAQQMSQADQQLIPQAIELLKDSPLSNFRIDVEADSLVQLDEDQNKRNRVEFLQALGGFLGQALPVGRESPEMVPMLVEVMKFGIGGFKQAQPIEGSLDTALEQMKAAAAQPKEPQPNPDEIKMRAQQQLEQMKMQAQQQSEQMRLQADAQAAQMKAQIDAQAQQARMQADMQIQQMKLQAEAQLADLSHQMAMHQLQSVDQFNRYKADLDSSTRILVAEIGAKAQIDKVREAEEAANTEVAIVLGQA